MSIVKEIKCTEELMAPQSNRIEQMFLPADLLSDDEDDFSPRNSAPSTGGLRTHSFTKANQSDPNCPAE